MVIERKYWPWKPSLFTQYRIRIANELHLAQRHEHSNELRRQITLVEEDINQILKQMTPIDFAQIDQKLNSCITSCKTEQKRTLKEYNRIKKQLIHLTPKLLIANSYFHSQYNQIPIKTTSLINNKKRRKRLKLTTEQHWKTGIRDAYQRIQTQRDKEAIVKHNQPVNISIPFEPLPIINDEPPMIIQDHEFIPPLPPPPIDEIIVPFQTPPLPPIACRSPPSDRLQFAVDDTIVKPHRLINKTLGNITHMSFHIDPDQCSSPKPEDKKKKKKLMLPPPPPPAPLFSSTAIFDTHAFFTQTNTKTKKQKKKIDISRQPIVMTTATNDHTQKKKGRTKKLSPYDFQDDDNTTLSRSKGAKLLTDDIITARFAKNSHYQSHQSSMASTKSTTRRDSKKKRQKKKNILGIGTNSPLTSSANLTLSPGRLSLDDEYDITKCHNKTKTKRKRTRVK